MVEELRLDPECDDRDDKDDVEDRFENFCCGNESLLFFFLIFAMFFQNGIICVEQDSLLFFFLLLAIILCN